MELRDLLQLLYSAHNRFTTVQLRWQYKYHADTLQEAFERWSWRHSPGNMKPWPPASKLQNEREMKIVRREIWWQKPSCWRQEEQIEGKGKNITIICKDRFWSFNSDSRKLYTNVAPQKKPLPFRLRKKSRATHHMYRIEDAINDVPLLDPSFLLASHDLQPIESAIYLERDVLRVRAVCRKAEESVRDSFFWNSFDEYDLLVDEEQGTLLRYAAKLRGEEFAIAAVERILFDEPIPESFFSFTPPPGASIRLAAVSSVV